MQQITDRADRHRIVRDTGGDWRRWREMPRDPETLRCGGAFPAFPSGFNPAAFGTVTPASFAKTAIWLSADSAVDDGSGNASSVPNRGNDTALLASASQATAGLRPAITTVGGIAALRFVAASGQYLAGAFGSVKSQPTTWFASFRFNSAITQNIYDGTDITNRQVLQLQTGGIFRMYAGATLDGTFTVALATNYVHMALFNSTSSVGDVDGSADASGSAGANSSGGLTLGAKYDGTSAFDGWWFQIVGYMGNAVADGTATAITNYLLAHS